MRPHVFMYVKKSAKTKTDFLIETLIDGHINNSRLKAITAIPAIIPKIDR